MEENPLESSDSSTWARLIEALDPSSLLFLIERKLSGYLKTRVTPEDVWQHVQLIAWRDRKKCDWRGIRAYRRWILRVIDHQIVNLAEREAAEKRTGGQGAAAFQAREDGPDPIPEAVARSTTPSRVASWRERASLIREALDAVPDDCREIVRLRLFEELSVEEVADRVGLGISATKHRFRKGFDTYHRLIKGLLGSRDEKP